MAVTKFVARKVGMAGKSDLEFAQADMVLCHADDLWPKYGKLRFAKDKARMVQPFKITS